MQVPSRRARLETKMVPDSDHQGQDDVIVRHYRISPRKIVLLKSILEGYEGLVVVRTADPAQGVVQLLISPDFAEVMEEILKDLSSKIRLDPVPAPPAGECLPRR